ncbi:IclR family transcriptional regulator [Hydrogenophaga intermedia]|uniref:Transcriptional regulator, IclR family protein n=1 Tax=Hydrogenophaga intermedia TaxID=65786 RepID=A0A1L1PJW6_HYDIT|nr:IclR family transcriptional regulator [Hydrogenophaga intermedia]CDN90292.1 Transcriptional regulator, IclR family protein [Hydrogenophaga intermedia]
MSRHSTNSPPGNGVKSAQRTLDVLEILAHSERALSHAELASRAAVPKSSLTQLLRTLQARDYVESMGPNGPYRLGASAVNLIRHGQDIQRLVASARPHMERLALGTRYSAGLNILRGDIVERILGVTADEASGYAMHEGVRAPLYASSSGKLFLAHMKSEDMTSYLDRVQLRPITSRSLKSASELRRQIRLAREEGVAYSRDEFTRGIVGASVPVVSAHGRMIASLGLAVPSAEFDAQKDTVLTHLRKAAHGISTQLSAARTAP